MNKQANRWQDFYENLTPTTFSQYMKNNFPPKFQDWRKHDSDVQGSGDASWASPEFSWKDLLSEQSLHWEVVGWREANLAASRPTKHFWTGSFCYEKQN